MPNDCGCSGSSQTPPGQGSTPSSPISASAFGGVAIVRRPGCSPPTCPQPPTSDAEERSPYCPTWIQQITAAAAGGLLLAIEGCLFLLQSKCTGFLYYDAATGQTSVKNPDAVSSLPREARYGWLGKVVPTIRKVCVDGVETCVEEVHQELAAQVMGDSDCGNLVLARSPLCGDLSPAEAVNADTQVEFSYLAAKNHEDIGCPEEVRFLTRFAGNRGDRNNTPCNKHSWMRRLRLRGSQWGQIAEGTPAEGSAFVAILVPVEGGTSDDPCFELRLSAQKLGGGVPKGTENCQILQYRDKGLLTEGWKAKAGGLMFHPVERRDLYTSNSTGSGALNLTLSDFPEDACGPIWAEVEVIIGTTAGPSGGSSRLLLSSGSYNLCYNGDGTAVVVNQAKFPITSADITLTRGKTGTGTASLFIRLLGYWY